MTAALLVLLLAADAPPADLMKKLADSTAAMQKAADAADVTIDTLAEQLDKAGKSTDTTDVVVRVTHPGGHEHEELVKYVEDGKDLTAEKKAKAAKDDAKKKDDDGGENEDVPIPFSATRQPRYRFVSQGADDQGRLRIHYEPAGEPTKDDGVGDALVDVAAGTLVEMTWSPAKLPTMVKELAMTLTFTQDPAHGPLLSKIEGHGRAGVLFVQKRFRITTTFSEYSF